MKFPLRIIMAILVGVTLSERTLYSDDVGNLSTQESRTIWMQLLNSVRKPLSDANVRQLTASGETLPLIQNLLYGTGPFEKKGANAYQALRLLQAWKNPETLPLLLDYVRSEKAEMPVFAMRILLEIQNDREIRDFVVDTLNDWIKQGSPKIVHIEHQFVPFLLNTPIKSDDVMWIVQRVKTWEMESRGSIFYQLVANPTPMNREVLQFYVEKFPWIRPEVGVILKEAVQLHSLRLHELSRAENPPPNAQQLWQKKDWEKYRQTWMAYHQQTLDMLMENFKAAEYQAQALVPK